MLSCIGNQALPASKHLAVEVLKISSEAPDRQLIEYAASFVRRGRVVAIPTDTFYGLCRRSLQSRRHRARVSREGPTRSRRHSRFWSIRSSRPSRWSAMFPKVFSRSPIKFWPGALTLVVEATHRLPLKVTGNTGRVALRWPDSRIASALIEAAGGPVTGTSANLSGYPSCTNAASDHGAARRPPAADSGLGRYRWHPGVDHRAHRRRQLVRSPRRRPPRMPKSAKPSANNAGASRGVVRRAPSEFDAASRKS